MKRLIVLSWLFFSLSVSAAEYDYYTSDHLGLNQHFGSISSACIAGFSGLDFKEGRRYGTTNGFRCVYNYQTGTTLGETQNGWAYGHKANCPEGQVYNPETKQCEPPKDCSDAGSNIFRGGNSSISTGADGVRRVTGRLDGPVCYQGCEFDIMKTASCYALPGESDIGFCNYQGRSNGLNCSAPDAQTGGTGDQLNPPPEVPDPDEPPSDPNDPGCPPGYSWSGTTCVKAPPGDGGDGGDGGDNGGDNGGDSGGNNGGGNNGGNNGGGDNGGNNGGGDNGGGDNGGDNGGNNGGNNGGGTGNGDGEGEDKEGNTGKSSADCSKRPTYSGDPLLGEILVQQWHTLCAGEELTGDKLGSGLKQAGFVDADTLDNVLGKDAENLDNQVSGIISGLATGGPSSSCPLTDASINTPWGTLRFPWTVNCVVFNVISAVIFFFAYLAAGWIVFNALARDD